MYARLATVAALFRVAVAFSDTAPVVAWASKRSEALDLLPKSFAPSDNVASVLENIFADSSVCSHDAVILVDQPSLHASDLRDLSPASALSVTLSRARSSIQFPYVKRASVDEASPSLDNVAESLASRCGARRTRYDPARTDRPTLEAGEKYVIHVDMPALAGAGSLRKTVMAAHESLLSAEIETISATLPDHLIIYTSSFPPTLTPRQFPSAPEPRPFVIANDTLPEGGVLARYQLLTPGLIMSLLVAFFLLVPAVFMGVSALASIRSPLRMEAPKGFNAQERKNQ